MVAPIGLDKLSGYLLKPIDIAEAVLYAVGAPQRVNVSLPGDIVIFISIKIVGIYFVHAKTLF